MDQGLKFRRVGDEYQEVADKRRTSRQLREYCGDVCGVNILGLAVYGVTDNAWFLRDGMRERRAGMVTGLKSM
jgi:hypothetical protein